MRIVFYILLPKLFTILE